MKKFFTPKNMAALGLLTALVIVLQLMSNYVTFGPVAITLSLTPIIVGAILYGPIAGAFLGLVNGVIVMLAPSTLAVFFPINPLATVLICLIKTTVAGLLAGFIFMPFKKKNKFLLLGSILASLAVPIVNTSIFALGATWFFSSLNESGTPTFIYVVTTMIGTNFIIELVVNSVLSPTVYKIYKYVENRFA